MRLLAFLRKILARALARIKFLNLSRNAKIALLLGVALLFKIASVSSGKAAPKFTTIPISQFLGPMNKRVLETVVVYPEMLQARDKFNNLLRATHQGMPVAALYNELKQEFLN